MESRFHRPTRPGFICRPIGATQCPLIALAFFSLALVCATPSVSAQSQLYWVGQLNSNWSQSNWSTSPSGSPAAPPPVSTSTAIFSAAKAKSSSANIISPAAVGSLVFTADSQVTIASGAALSVASGSLSASNSNSSVSGAGALSIPGSLTKTGNGQLRLDANTFVGGTADIQSGTLEVNGSLLAESVRIRNGATLAGTGALFAPVQVSGTLSPGNSVGRLAVGSLTLLDGSQTTIEISSRQSNDVIIVNGDAALGGRLRVAPIAGHSLSYGDSHTLLLATGRIQGAFESINLPTGFRGRFLNSGQVGTLLVAPDSYTRVATNPNQRSTAKALDSFIPATSGDRATVSLALDRLTAAEYPAAFDQVAPALYATLPASLVEQAFNQAQMISQRLALARAGVGGAHYIGIPESELRYDRNGKSVADPKTMLPLPQETARANWKTWAMATGQFAQTKDWSGVPSNRNNSGGFLAGLDYAWNENFTTGLFAGYQYSQATFLDGGSAKGNGLFFGLYAAYADDQGFHADALVGGGYTGFQTRRPVSFGDIDRTASADPGAGQLNIALNLGKDWRAGSFLFGPLAGLQYTYASTAAFTEQGADSLDLGVDPVAANSLRSTLGARAVYVWQIGKNLVLLPEVRALWMHEFLAQPLDITSRLDAGRGASFDYSTGTPYADSLFAGAGLGFRLGEQFTGSIFYNVNFAGTDYVNNIISADLNYAF
jgi:uncharacterized protein with beta-barrel porin domain